MGLLVVFIVLVFCYTIDISMKTKNKKASTHQRKRAGLHQKRSPNFLKAYHPFIPLLAFALVALALFSFRPNTPDAPQIVKKTQSVLAYATNINASGLLSSTNQRRSAAGVASLTTNSKLNSAAQAKANDMATRNYWAHNTPEGNPPWVFINNAGYSYTKAGENLACGFNDSTSVITGWYNSAAHKANLLDSSFKEVGFGIVNASNYNCGEWAASPQTIVVAMYGTPTVSATPAPSTPAPSESSSGSSAGGSTQQPTASASTSGSSAASKPKNKSVESHTVVLTVLNSDGTPSADTQVTLHSDPQTAKTDDKGMVKFTKVEPGEHNVEVELLGAKSETTIELDGKEELFELSIIKPELGSNTTGESDTKPSSQPINRLSVFTEKYAPWVLSTLIILCVAGVLFVLTKHSIAAHKFFIKGEQYVLNHKIIDVAVILLLVALFYLTRSIGVIL